MPVDRLTGKLSWGKKINANLLLPQNNNRTIGRGRNINVRRYFNQHFVISAKMMCKVEVEVEAKFVSENFWGNKNNQLINPIPRAWTVLNNTFNIQQAHSHLDMKDVSCEMFTCCGHSSLSNSQVKNEMKCQKRYPSLQIYHPINAVRTFDLLRSLETTHSSGRPSTFDFQFQVDRQIILFFVNLLLPWKKLFLDNQSYYSHLLLSLKSSLRYFFLPIGSSINWW